MKISYREALRLGLKDALGSDPRVFLMGEDVGAYGGTYAVSKGLLEEFGPDRIRDAPLSELGFTGLGVGAAMGGLKPIVEIMTVNFSLLALDQIVNSAAILRHMSGGQVSVPLVIRMTTGGGRQLAAQHSNSFEGWFSHIPGLRILAPGTISDARFMLAEALKEQDPVLVVEHALLLAKEDECPTERPNNYSAYRAEVRREGGDITLVTYGGMVYRSIEAAEKVSKQGLSVEVIDLKSLRPLDMPTVFKSLKKTHRVLIVDEGWKSLSLSSEIAARIAEEALYDLDAPVQRLCRKEVPIPYSKHLEDFAIPQVDDIASRLMEMKK